MGEQANPITEITLKNYGKFSDQSFQLTPGLNVIRGPNRSGKTWILRALSTVLTNTGYWNDDNDRDEIRFVDDNGEIADSFTVTAHFESGLGIRRYRDSSTNMYAIQEPGTRTWDKLTAIGSGFYDPIGEHTGIFPVSLDGRSTDVINIKMMTDPPFFLLSESEKNQNRILTRLVGMDVVEAAEQDVSKDIRSLQSDLRDIETKCSEARETAEKYAPARDAVCLVAQAEKLVEQREELSKTIERGQKSLSQLNDVEKRISLYRNRIAVWEELVPILEQHVNRAREATSTRKKAQELFNELNDKQKQLDDAQYASVVLRPIEQAEARCQDAVDMGERVKVADEILTEFQSVEQQIQFNKRIVELLKDLLPVAKERISRVREKSNECEKALALWDRLENTAASYKNAKQRVLKEQSALDKLWDSVDVCPLCERRL